MGLFSKKKDAPDAPKIPTEPVPEIEGLSMPPVPGAKDPILMRRENNLSNVPDGSNLTPPSLPGSGLDDIKSQVVGDNMTQMNNKMPQKQEITSEAFDVSEVSSDEDLFNMFKVEDSDIVSSSSNTTELPSSRNSESLSFDNNTEDTHLTNDTALTFETKHVSKKDETIFLTTTQFKALLGVVDSVKSKIKITTETHLKLMDMKAEEDVEYESLRKNFQHIEDQLHDLDGILFNE